MAFVCVSHCSAFILTHEVDATIIYFAEEVFDANVRAILNSPKMSAKKIEKKANLCRTLINLFVTFGLESVPYVIKLVVSSCLAILPLCRDRPLANQNFLTASLVIFAALLRLTLHTGCSQELNNLMTLNYPFNSEVDWIQKSLFSNVEC